MPTHSALGKANRSDIGFLAPREFWACTGASLLEQLRSRDAGLTSAEAASRRRPDRHALQTHQPLSRLRVLGRQIQSPLLWLLIFASTVATAVGDWSDALIVAVIVTAAIAIGYLREYRAGRAAELLAARVSPQAWVLRDGQPQAIPREAVVVGDVLLLRAGTLIAADAVVLEATDCFVSEGLLTGESMPVQKHADPVAASSPLASRANCVYLGTSVRSGTARAVVVAVGSTTEFAHIARRLIRRPPEAAFDRGIRRFGYFLTSWMLVIVVLVFVAHVLAGRPPAETLLFSVALAVGLSPELLPAILSVGLARGAQMMARRGVLVRRLNAIENLGSMDVLCTDKTGTLTEGAVRLEGAYDAEGVASTAVLTDAALNAGLQTGLANPLDAAILQSLTIAAPTAEKVGEIPFDFERKRLSVVVGEGDGARLITKGAVVNVLALSTQTSDRQPIDAARRDRLLQRFAEWSRTGMRVIAVAWRPIDRKPGYSPDDEAGLTLSGFLTFQDPPKPGAAAAIADLRRLGVSVKLLTGDNEVVTRHVAALIGMSADQVLTGADIARVQEPALSDLASRTDLFAELDPNQKERIILALRRAGHVVGFLGDGINDAPAMHAADTSLSVDGAADVAREVADFVLLDRDLEVIRGGIEEGRRTFVNTLKYILTTNSANLGNMISMAAASLFLPFLPLLASQILLNNLLSDVPAVGIADDAVDAEQVARPPRWDMWFIARFMVVFGLLSSVFDALTFAALLWLFNASVELFRSGWFVESLLTELVIALVVRTRRPFFASRPGTLLLATSLAMIAVTIALPFTTLAPWVGLLPLPVPMLVGLLVVAALYVVAAEIAKAWFYRSGAAAWSRPASAAAG